MFVNRNLRAAQLTAAYLRAVRRASERSPTDGTMLLPTFPASPALLLQLCVSVLRRILCVFSEVFKWTARSGAAPVSPVSPLDGSVSRGKIQDATTPTSVNYHFTRKCNYKCGFCFHTAKTSFVLPLEEAKRGLHLLKESGEFLYLRTVCSVSALLYAHDFMLPHVRHGKDQLLRRRAFPAR